MTHARDLTTYRQHLAALDPAALRSSPDRMRAALADLARAGSPLWTAPMPVLVEALAATARVDLCLARLVEGHADAMRILDQADERPREGAYGVWASRSAGTGLAGRFHDDRWTVSGELRFASGVDLIDRALVPVLLDDGHQQLLDLSLVEGKLDADPASWQTQAMDASRSWTVTVDAVAPLTAAVGPRDFYLDRPGFVVGGLGPAAVWVGGAEQVLDLLRAAAAAYPPDSARLRRIGRADQALWEARTCVRAVAGLVEAQPPGLGLEVRRARTVAAEAAERVVAEAGRVVGPGGLSRDSRMIRATGDLALYARQLAVDAELEARGREVVRGQDLTR